MAGRRGVGGRGPDEARGRAAERGVAVRRAAALALALASPLALVGCAGWFFQPVERHVRTPAAFALDYEDVALRSADGTPLHAWLVYPETEPVGRVLFLHGNAQNVSHHLPGALWWVAEGHELVALDYRGYGRSGGVPGVDGAVADVAAGVGFLARRSAADGLPAIVFGQSLGASLATLALGADAGARAGVDALVLEAGFAGFGRVAGDVAAGHPLTWALQWVPRLTLARLDDPVDAIAEVDLPVAIVHSVDDRIVGIDHARSLFEAAPGPKRLIETTGRHIAAAADPAVREAVLGFVADTVAGGPR